MSQERTRKRKSRWNLEGKPDESALLKIQALAIAAKLAAKVVAIDAIGGPQGLMLQKSQQDSTTHLKTIHTNTVFLKLNSSVQDEPSGPVVEVHTRSTNIALTHCSHAEIVEAVYYVTLPFGQKRLRKEIYLPVEDYPDVNFLVLLAADDMAVVVVCSCCCLFLVVVFFEFCSC